MEQAEHQDSAVQTAIVKPVAASPMEIAEIETQIATAKRYPRDIAKFKNTLEQLCCTDRETAELCIYAVPRGGKTLQGPSVRLAEMALSCYGNCAVDSAVTTEDETHIHAHAQIRDLENNIAVRIGVSRRIVDKDGNRFSPDMVTSTANAAVSLAFRNAIFKAIPAVFLRPIFNRIRQVAVGQAKSLAARRSDVLGRLQKMGVSQERALAAVGRERVTDVTADDVAQLIGLGTRLHEGTLDLDEAFPLEQNVDRETGEVLKDAGSGRQSEGKQPTLDDEKKKLIEAMKNALEKAYPGKRHPEKKAKQDLLVTVFGKKSWRSISAQPLEILKAGKTYIIGRLADLAEEGDIQAQSEADRLPAGGDEDNPNSGPVDDGGEDL